MSLLGMSQVNSFCVHVIVPINSFLGNLVCCHFSSESKINSGH